MHPPFDQPLLNTEIVRDISMTRTQTVQKLKGTRDSEWAQHIITSTPFIHLYSHADLNVIAVVNFKADVHWRDQEEDVQSSHKDEALTSS